MSDMQKSIPHNCCECGKEIIGQIQCAPDYRFYCKPCFSARWIATGSTAIERATAQADSDNQVLDLQVGNKERTVGLKSLRVDLP